MALLSGCASVDRAAEERLDYELSPQGIEVIGTGLFVSFGRAQAGAMKALEKLAGPVVRATEVPGCGTVLVFSDKASGTVKGDVFTGWTMPDGRSRGERCDAVR